MGFFQLLKSLDELLYEVMSWLVFYPITLWRALRHPLKMMDYADTELGDAADEQYTDTLSPPLFLLLTLLISHAVELAVVGDSPIVKSTRGLDSLIMDDTSLIVLRIAMFSLFPLIMAVRLVRLQKVGIDRNTLRAPFYSQCYVTAPFALVLGLAGALTASRLDAAVLASAALVVAALIWFGLLQARWFAQHLKTGFGRGFWNASVAMIASLIAVGVVTALFS